MYLFLNIRLPDDHCELYRLPVMVSGSLFPYRFQKFIGFIEILEFLQFFQFWVSSPGRATFIAQLLPAAILVRPSKAGRDSVRIILLSFELMLDLDKLDPDWQMASNHGRACSPGFLKQINPNGLQSLGEVQALLREGHGNFCRCCLRVIDKTPIPLCENTKELEFLGFGFPLYFVFNKYAMILLTLQIVSYSVLSLYWAVESTHEMCAEGKLQELPGGHEGMCHSWLIMFMRAEHEVTTKEELLRVSSFVIQLLGLIYIRDTIYKTLQYYEERNTLISDFAVIFMNLPQEIGSIGKIRSFLEALQGGYDVEEVIVLNSLQDFFQLKEQKLDLVSRKKECVRMPESREKQRRLADLNRKIQEREQLMKQEHLKEMEMIRGDTAICDKAVVVLASESQKNALIAEMGKVEDYVLLEHFGVEGLGVIVQRAPEPKQIIWQNINYPNSVRLVRLAVGWLLTALLLGAVTIVFYFIFQAKSKAIHKMSEGTATMVTILTMVMITFFNKFVISSLLHHITEMEMHRTGSEYEFSFGLKYTFGLFFTTALMTLLVEGFIHKNIYSEPFGIVEEESMMFFFNSFLIPIIWLVHPWQLAHLIKRWYYFGRKDLTQNEANLLMENSRYSVGKKYAEVTESVWFTYLYASLIPGGAVLITLGFGFFYWVDKCVVLRRSSINPNVNGELSMRSIKLLDATLIMRCAGEIIFDNMIRKSWTWGSGVCLCVAVIYLLLPMDQLLSYLHGESFEEQQKSYSEAKHLFIENYITLNPLFYNELEAALSKPDAERNIMQLDFHLLAREFECEKPSSVQVFDFS